MRGSIRVFVGFLIAYGSMGTLEVDATASVVAMTALAVVGLGLMYSGVRAMKAI